MIHWVVEERLARGRRPGCAGGRGAVVPRAEVDRWLEDVRSVGVKSIIRLLAEDQLRLCPELPSDLVAYYRRAGFSVAYIPARDHQSPPLTESHLAQIWDAYRALPKPVLIHCGAGIDRTGRAAEHITKLMDGAA